MVEVTGNTQGMQCQRRRRPNKISESEEEEYNNGEDEKPVKRRTNDNRQKKAATKPRICDYSEWLGAAQFFDNPTESPAPLRETSIATLK